jgi:hypothetical protein
VVELESSLLMPAPESVAPPAPSSAVGGFLHDPFAAAAALPKGTPAVAPPRAVEVAPMLVVGRADGQLAEEPPPPSVTGSPHFAAAMDRPPLQPLQPPAHAPLPPPIQLPIIAPSVEQPPEPEDRGARRRKFVVLGSVAVLGATIFALAALRVAGREQSAPPEATRPSVANAQAAPPPATPPPVLAASATEITPPAASTAPTPAPAPTPTSASAPTAAIATPPPQAQTAQTAPVHTAPATTHPAPVVTTPPRAAPATAAPAPRPRPKPTFDPNSL